MLSIPELSASDFGITYRALANALTTSCCLPDIDFNCYLKQRDSYISMAPPPATTAYDLIARRTIIIASLRDLYASSKNWSAPPLSTIVADLACSQNLNKLNLSAPSWTYSNSPQVPNTYSLNPLTVV